MIKRGRERERDREKGERKRMKKARVRRRDGEREKMSETGLEGSLDHATVIFSRRSQAGTQTHWQNCDRDSLRPGWLGIAPVKTS